MQYLKCFFILEYLALETSSEALIYKEKKILTKNSKKEKSCRRWSQWGSSHLFCNACSRVEASMVWHICVCIYILFNFWNSSPQSLYREYSETTVPSNKISEYNYTAGSNLSSFLFDTASTVLHCQAKVFFFFLPALIFLCPKNSLVAIRAGWHIHDISVFAASRLLSEVPEDPRDFEPFGVRIRSSFPQSTEFWDTEKPPIALHRERCYHFGFWSVSSVQDSAAQHDGYNERLV